MADDPEVNAEVNAGTEAMTYERARDELAEIVRRLEAGGHTLEESLRLWERGERLAEVCTQWLEGARARLAEAIAGPERPREPSENDGQGGPDAPSAGRSDEAPF